MTSSDHQVGHALVTSAGAKASMIRAVQAALQRLSANTRVVAGDADRRAVTRYVADDFWVMPRLDDIDPPDLLRECRARGIRFVIPSRDGELMFWARHRALFAEAGIAVIVSEPDSVALCLDKLAFAERCAALGLPCISAAINLEAISSERFVVKERFGSGSRNIGLNLNSEEALHHARSLSSPIFQPYVTGREISADAWMSRTHEPHGVVLRHRDVVVHGESQVTTTFRDPHLESRIASVFRELRLRGPAVLQAIITDAGDLWMIECNARFGGASTASIAAGLDVFHWSFLEATSGDDLPAFVRMGHELRQVRVAQDVVINDPDL